MIGTSFRVFEKAGLSGLFLYGALIAGICGVLGHPAMAAPLALDVAKAAVSFEPRTNQALITFTLKEASRRSFADFTAANVGRTIEIRIDGRIMTKPVIREPITGGIGQVAGSFSAGEAKAMADRLTSGAARLEVEAVP